MGGNVFANENLGDYYDSRVAQWTMSEVPPATIKKIRTRAFVRFYANPVRLWHIARTMPQKKQLLFLFMLLLMRTFRSVIPVEKIIVKLRRLRIADPLPAEA
ncbi:MAG: hypothetical protein M5R36_03000 [Deltaproteobacteria bacterium]|nr:hypothetical protein [Deltaproteobacteria bacterium]